MPRAAKAAYVVEVNNFMVCDGGLWQEPKDPQKGKIIHPVVEYISITKRGGVRYSTGPCDAFEA
jgi:hypothetical protein